MNLFILSRYTRDPLSKMSQTPSRVPAFQPIESPDLPLYGIHAELRELGFTPVYQLEKAAFHTSCRSDCPYSS